MREKIGVIGAGSWGTTLANLLAKKGHEVTLWAYEQELVEEMGRTSVNGLFLPGITLDPGLRYTNDLAEAVRGKGMVLCVAPSQVVRKVIAQLLPSLAVDAVIVSASKGIELDTLLTVSQVYEELLPPELYRNFAVISGPSFAREVAMEMPTAVVAAAADEQVARRVQQAFSTPYFRLYTNRDVVGVELGGAIKNVIAIAAGISDGLGFGCNTRAALITRGLAEMSRLGRAMGAESATFAGLAGMGDLVLTCTGDLSRNRTVGIQLGKGRLLADILGEMRMVAEGVKTTESAYALARRLGIDMPITAKVYEVLHEDKPARSAVIELMGRDLKAESS
ncbi:NAD(P)H-dependent glycerol-3-phosphate dehydrogenase [Geobacter sp. AOG1]|uniref:NAD(P)H-dependent glycerol-3-phosphate dehydrogenase n=1 Tax=Geobacter sp. AOG1 TaxID=1566346 RepID=UPI001CC6077D|nr:NAD(P)H-dependent glycerol-3-phosphate dehydrogenase [Geobacter sp. AOG1]GFE56973.1 glycerol-3-phosphate dehydrogenase [NAD(P)+] [Geobacter sp. AOG1]